MQASPRAVPSVHNTACWPHVGRLRGVGRTLCRKGVNTSGMLGSPSPPNSGATSSTWCSVGPHSSSCSLAAPRHEPGDSRACSTKNTTVLAETDNVLPCRPASPLTACASQPSGVLAQTHCNLSASLRSACLTAMTRCRLHITFLLSENMQECLSKRTKSATPRSARFTALSTPVSSLAASAWASTRPLTAAALLSPPASAWKRPVALKSCFGRCSACARRSFATLGI